MDKKEFERKAKEYGDFYLYYLKEGSRSLTTYLVGTLDTSSPWLQEAISNQARKPTASEEEAVVFSFSSNKLRSIPYSRIKRLVPLSKILRNS